MTEVREKHGLAYMVGSLMQTSYYTNHGEWFAYSQTRTEKTAEAISLIIDVVMGLRDVPVPQDELQRYQRFASSIHLCLGLKAVRRLLSSR